MLGRGNPYTRVWREVFEVYKEVAKEHGLAISDLVSIVLLYTPIFSPFVIALGLEDNYDSIDKEEAIIISKELEAKLKNMVGIAFSQEEEEEKEEKIKVQKNAY